MNNLISNVIENIREEYIYNEFVSTYREINNGYCPEFAEEVVSIIDDENVTNVSMDNFMIDEEFNGDGNDKWDQDILKEWGIPYNKELDNIVFGYHVWITDGEKHYDAECPEGVYNFFELPFFKRYL